MVYSVLDKATKRLKKLENVSKSRDRPLAERMFLDFNGFFDREYRESLVIPLSDFGKISDEELRLRGFFDD